MEIRTLVTKGYQLLFVLPVTFSLLVSGCASIPKAIEENSSAVAITVVADVYSSPMVTDTTLKPEKVFFVRLADQNAGILKGEIVASNYQHEAWWSSLKSGGIDSFLLNIPAGTYAAIAVSGSSGGGSPFSSGGNPQTVFFPENVVKASIVTVKPGIMAYMGTFKFNSVSFWNGMKEADKVQTNYFDALRESGFSSFVTQPYAATIDKIINSKNDEKSFLEKYLGTFANTGWEEKIKQRLNEIEK
jgi:hypothetical protein